MEWHVSYPSGWEALPEEDRAYMLGTYIAREQMRAIEAYEQQREANRAATRGGHD